MSSADAEFLSKLEEPFNDAHCHSLTEVASYFLKPGPYSENDHKKWIMVMLEEADYLYIPSHGKVLDPKKNLFQFEDFYANGTAVATSKGPALTPQYFTDLGYPVSPHSPVLRISGERYPVDLIKVHFPVEWYHDRYSKHFESPPYDEVEEMKKTGAEFERHPSNKDYNICTAVAKQFIQDTMDMMKIQKAVKDLKPTGS